MKRKVLILYLTRLTPENKSYSAEKNCPVLSKVNWKIKVNEIMIFLIVARNIYSTDSRIVELSLVCFKKIQD